MSARRALQMPANSRCGRSCRRTSPLLAEIFRASIEELTGDDYSEAQQEAWAAAADDDEAFGARLAERADARRHLWRLAGRVCLARRQ